MRNVPFPAVSAQYRPTSFSRGNSSSEVTPIVGQIKYVTMFDVWGRIQVSKMDVGVCRTKVEDDVEVEGESRLYMWEEVVIEQSMKGGWVLWVVNEVG